MFATDRSHRDKGQPTRPPGSGMINHTWYVTFEVPRTGALVQRRNPRLTKTFETEAEARDFARAKFDGGLIVTAGTINPHLPRRAIPSEEIPAWRNRPAAGIEGRGRLARASNEDRLVFTHRFDCHCDRSRDRCPALSRAMCTAINIYGTNFIKKPLNIRPERKL